MSKKEANEQNSKWIKISSEKEIKFLPGGGVFVLEKTSSKTTISFYTIAVKGEDYKGSLQKAKKEVDGFIEKTQLVNPKEYSDIELHTRKNCWIEYGSGFLVDGIKDPESSCICIASESLQEGFPCEVPSWRLKVHHDNDNCDGAWFDLRSFRTIHFQLIKQLARSVFEALQLKPLKKKI